MTRLTKQPKDILSNIYSDSFTFSNASPEHSFVFIGPPRFFLDNVTEKNNLITLLSSVRRALYVETIRAASEGGASIHTALSEDVGTIKDFEVSETAFDDIAYDKTNNTITSYHLFSVLGMAQELTDDVRNQVRPIGQIGSRKKAFLTQDSLTQVTGRVSNMLMLGASLTKMLLSNKIYEEFAKGDLDITNAPSVVKDWDLFKAYANNLSAEYLANYSSDLTKLPFGLGVIKCDRQYRVCSAEFFNGARIANNATQFMAGQPGIIESVDFLADSKRNLNLNDLKTVLANLGGV
jgi:hypothetical protein